MAYYQHHQSFRTIKVDRITPMRISGTTLGCSYRLELSRCLQLCNAALVLCKLLPEIHELCNIAQHIHERSAHMVCAVTRLPYRTLCEVFR